MSVINLKVQDQQQQILYNVINAGIAGLLVFAGSFTTGHITLEGVGLAAAAALVVMLTKFQTYWTKLGKNGQARQLFTFF